MNEKCCKVIWNGSFGQYSSACGKNAKFEVNGKHYCGIHNPNKGPTKSQIEAEQRREEERKRWKIQRAAPDLLNSLKIVIEWMDNPDESAFSDAQLEAARAAIAKAEGIKS